MAKNFTNPWGKGGKYWAPKWMDSNVIIKTRQQNTEAIDYENIVAPAGYIKYKSVDKTALFIPTSANVELYKEDNPVVANNSTVKTEALKGEVRSFTIEGKRYVAFFDSKTGNVSGYYDSNNKQYYTNPKGLISDGTISKISWGESRGLYPTGNGQSIAHLYQPKYWNYEMSLELLKARAGMQLIGTQRNTKVNKKKAGNVPDFLKPTLPWHMIENFPNADSGILNDQAVKYYYMNENKNAKDPALNYQTHNVTMVQRYGPFYNVGGGSAKQGPQYILFYKAIPK